MSAIDRAAALCLLALHRLGIMDFIHPHWPVFYEDNHLLVLYKPAGLIIQRDHKNRVSLLDLAKSWLKVRYAKPGEVFVGMVHRLDAPVAGVVIMARTSKAAGRLSRQFREGKVIKNYLAVVQGCPQPGAGRLSHWLGRQGRLSRPVAAATPAGQQAVLSYRLLETAGRLSLLAVDLETGRRHQIRAQLSAIGCPIVGDRAYGAHHLLPYGRIALVARRTVFDHPTRHTPIELQCPPPRDWPWDIPTAGADRPLWSIEEFQADGLVLGFAAE